MKTQSIPIPKKRMVDREDIVIPASAVTGAKFFEHGKVTVNVMDNMIVLNKSEMSPSEMKEAANKHLGLAYALFNKCGIQSGSAKADPFEPFAERFHPLIDACENCGYADFCEDDIYLPPCVLKKAGLSVDADLAFVFVDGGILITDAEGLGDEEGDRDE